MNRVSRRKFIKAFAFSSLVLTLGGACQGTPPSAPAAKEPSTDVAKSPPQPKAAPTVAGKVATVKAGILYLNSIPHSAPFHIATGKRFWEDEGIKFEAVEVTSPNDSIQALGKDFVFTNTSMNPPVVSYNQGNTDLRILAPLYQSTANKFCVRADSSIQEVRQIPKGAKVGITLPGASVHAFAQAMLAEAGLPTDHVEYVPLPGYAGMNAALLSGQVQITAVTDPLYSKQIRNGEIRLLWDPTARPGFKYNEGVFLTSLQVMRRDPDLLRALIRAIQRTYQFIQQNPQEAGQIWAAAIKADEPDAIATIERSKEAYSLKTDWATYVAVAEQMARFNQLQPTGKVPWKELFGDQSYLPEELRTPMPPDLPYS